MHACGVIDPATGLATKIPGPSWTATFSESLIEYADQAPRRRCDHRGHARSHRVDRIRRTLPGSDVRRRHRRAARHDLGGRIGHRRTASGGRDLFDVPQPGLRPDHDGRGAAQAAGHHRARPGRSHRAGWRQPQRHVGLSILGIVPGMRVAAPRDGARLHEELGEALDIDDGPTAIRFPKGDVGEDVPALQRKSGVDVLAVPAEGLGADVLLVAVGAFASMALKVAERLHNQGIGVTVVDPRWVLPVSDAIAELAVAHKVVVTLEDNGVAGGIGSAVSAALRPQRDRRAVPRRRSAAAVLRSRVAR